MAQTFHFFSQLPLELRKRIWSLAIRPNCPRAHIFTVHDEQEISDFRWEDLQLSVPKCLPKLVDAGNTLESSTYLTDGGLWTCCKESRLVMEQRFQRKTWDADQNRRVLTWEGSNKGDMPATAFFVDNDSIDHYITVVPAQDLFILQTHPPENTDQNAIARSIPAGPKLGKDGGLRNIAVEFDPALALATAILTLNQIDTRHIVEYFLKIALSKDVHMLWFIDYGMKRKQHALTKEQSEVAGDRVFSQPGRRFVEIDEGFWKSQWQHQTRDKDSPPSCRFADILRIAIAARRALLNHDQNVAAVGILACEYVET
ncbi:hypothetical protein AK830_g8528 [Neonectria ditissima]|uniref:2EXR domain-containing protein n=1 Tax=Neonectria ditissima TaxID=78410 RepID=A0A0N8H657_9HYPO|nr:hypothetical protein AK830_g8528 [Neonectria ditissima]